MRAASGSWVMRLSGVLVLVGAGFLFNTHFFREAAKPADQVVPLVAVGAHPSSALAGLRSGASYRIRNGIVLTADGTRPPPPPNQTRLALG